jgi:prophage DNA circulation protein
MTVARDWLKTLWRASYKGTPFFVENDEEDGGRRIVIHQFPMRDDPYLEDLGEDKRGFEVEAYVASDSADSDAGSLVVTCATRGAGILVLPTHGPILVRCLNFRRKRAKDRHGYICISLEFVREGASSPLVSVAMLANQIFVAADFLSLSIAASFLSNITVALQPDYVVATVTDGAQTAISTVEAIRTTEPVDPAVSATQRNEIQSIFDAAPALVDDPVNIGTLPTRIIASARAIGAALPAANAVSAFEAIVTDPSLKPVIASSYPTPRRRTAALNDAAAKQLLLLTALAAYCEGVARVQLADRPAAITLRANVSEYVGGILETIPAGDIDLFHAIETLRNATVEYLSRSILDLAPVVTVEANVSMPSLFWAWRLYHDPNRSTELVARNLVPHPSFMPTSFEALSK